VEQNILFDVENPTSFEDDPVHLDNGNFLRKYKEKVTNDVVKFRCLKSHFNFFHRLVIENKKERVLPVKNNCTRNPLEYNLDASIPTRFPVS